MQRIYHPKIVPVDEHNVYSIHSYTLPGSPLLYFMNGCMYGPLVKADQEIIKLQKRYPLLH